MTLQEVSRALIPWRLYPSLKIFCCKNSTSLCLRKRNERKYLQGLAKKKKNAVEPTMRSGIQTQEITICTNCILCVDNSNLFEDWRQSLDDRKGRLGNQVNMYIVLYFLQIFRTCPFIHLPVLLKMLQRFNVLVFVFVFVFVFVKGFQRRFRKERATACQSCREAQDPHLDLLSRATPAVVKRKSSLTFSRQPRRMGAIMKPSC